MRITYRKLPHYKYQLLEPYEHQTDLRDVTVATPGDWVRLEASGIIAFKSGYAWDGPSGPTIDTQNFMRGSLVHDGLYQLIRECDTFGMEHREYADELIRDICRKDGMSWIRSTIVYYALRWFGERAATRKPRKDERIHAPK